jgi:electron transport complex protein RnfB
MSHSEKNKTWNRREFLNKTFRVSAGIGLAGLGIFLAKDSVSEDLVWQIDPGKCTQCGRCAINCVLTPSAVKCFHVFDMCGYCDLCGGYFRPGSKSLHTGAENQLCPTGAIKRNFVEDPFFQYEIDEDLCIGCGKCVAGCDAFGNGSMQLQIRHDICVNCNQCAIATNCPADAFSRVPRSQPNISKGFSGGDQIEGEEL